MDKNIYIRIGIKHSETMNNVMPKNIIGRYVISDIFLGYMWHRWICVAYLINNLGYNTWVYIVDILPLDIQR